MYWVMDSRSACKVSKETKNPSMWSALVTVLIELLINAFVVKEKYYCWQSSYNAVNVVLVKD